MILRRSALVAFAAAFVLAAALSAHAQHAGKVHRIALLSYQTQDTFQPSFEVFRAAMRELGWIEGRNVTFERRHAAGKLELVPGLAIEIVKANPDLIVAVAPLSVRAARQATSTIPIVMIYGDPEMFVDLARPGGNVTGLAALAAELAGKQVELLKQAVPGALRIAVLRNPAQPVHVGKLREAEAAARALKLRLTVLDARTPDDFEAAFAAMAREPVDGLVVFADGMYRSAAAQLAELAARYRLPTIYGSAGHAQAGGLVEYAPNRDEAFQRAAGYVDRILKGARPGDLPVEQPTRFELTINAKAARTIGLTLPPALLLRAERVIE
jgi:putative ABC transport system substrate-binding protein